MMGKVIMSGIVPQLVAPLSVDPVLNNNSWETISKISQMGLAAQYWAVGDTKTITINGTVGNTTFSNLSVDAFILGFNHNSSREGANRIHFQIGKTTNGTDIAFCDSCYSRTGSSKDFRMNLSATNSGGWKESYGRKTLLGNSGTPNSPPANSFMAALPADLLAVMKSVKKYTNNKGDANNTASAVTATTDYLFLLAEFEIQGSTLHANGYEQRYQAQYDYYKAGNSKVKYRHDATGTSVHHWCRSAWCNGSEPFCCVNSNGTANAVDANYSYGLAPGFCV